MINTSDKKVILDCANKYGVETVILFGSSLSEENPNDIDIGVKGIQPEKFFSFYAELFRKCSLPVDLVNLSDKSLFNNLIEQEGEVIYG
ncbi:MAG: hypothetical protein H8E82_01720 [Candidatus Marinimicrobia bacterium]|nr:hypothetical protein [Candidatus Neomarinimicrobiota bacterium]MBL7047513.1 hypothetical protein [Candidatus Neomarinimicrobiota bacterium]